MVEKGGGTGKPVCGLCAWKTVRGRHTGCAGYEQGTFPPAQAAATGNVYAQYRLGRWYLTEEYKNISQAVRYLTMAVYQNHDLAAYHLGKLYLTGEGIPKNTELAVRYLEQSARAGNQYAQYTLGKVYLIGKDVGQDKEKAYAYFWLAAEQGNLYAAYF